MYSTCIRLIWRKISRSQRCSLAIPHWSPSNWKMYCNLLRERMSSLCWIRENTLFWYSSSCVQSTEKHKCIYSCSCDSSGINYAKHDSGVSVTRYASHKAQSNEASFLFFIPLFVAQLIITNNTSIHANTSGVNYMWILITFFFSTTRVYTCDQTLPCCEEAGPQTRGWGGCCVHDAKHHWKGRKHKLVWYTAVFIHDVVSLWH